MAISEPVAQEVDVVIIGAGVVGLTLAHSLQKYGVSYQILERDESIDSRGNGWGITIHWARDALRSCIPENIYNSLDSISVDPDMKNKDPGHYKFFNLETMEKRFAAPVDPERMRIRREGFRKLLLPGTNVKWASQVESIKPEEDGVLVTLPDDYKVRAKLLIGADGSNSATRKFLCPKTAENIPIPVRFLGVIVKLSSEMAHSIIDFIDPLTFQGCHPSTGVYMFWCLVSTPVSNGSDKSLEPYFQAQVCVSWPAKDGEPNVPSTSAEKVRLMQDLCSNMAVSIRNMVNAIPEDSEPISVKLQDWPCLDWDNHNGRITLAGDSSHAMTMYRGEAANFGITDAADIANAIVSFHRNEISQKEAIDRYEEKLRKRSREGVLASRQACIDAHNYAELTMRSPLLFDR